MSSADQLAIGSAAAFFVLGLVLGVAKYGAIVASEDARAPRYIDVGHRAALMYAFACLLIERMVELSGLADQIEFWAVLVQVAFFALATASYVVHGLWRDTDNQLRRPHRFGRTTVPPAAMVVFMAALIAGELGGFLTLVWGALSS